MIRTDILKNHNKIERNEVIISLNSIGDRLFGDKWKFVEGVNSYTISIIQNEKCDVGIGKAFINYGCHPKMVNKAGYVLAVEHMFHEERHVQQRTTESKIVHNTELTSNDRRMTDIIRRRFISDHYNSVYSQNYAISPEEMDAEVYGLQKAMKHFETDPLVSKTEAGDILYQFMMSEEYGHEKELSKYEPKSIEDVISAFTDLRNNVIHIPYTITDEKSSEMSEYQFDYDMTDRFLHEPRFESYRRELANCSDGRMMDKILEQTIVLEYPEHISSVPRLENELQQCYRQMNKRIFTPKSSVIPVSKIQYAGSSTDEEEFTAAVGSIPADEDIKL